MTETKGKSLVEITTQKIIDYITERKMEPGDKLPTETEFLETLDISRGTLREAFKILTARNVLEVRQGSGTFISANRGIPEDPLGLTFIYDDHTLALDLLETRLMLEPKIAVLAVNNATPAQKKALKAVHAKLVDNIRNNLPYKDEDEKFHQLIAEASGNKILANLSHILFSSIEKNIKLTLDVQKISNTLFYHEKLVNAILSGNIQEANHAMTMHLTLLWDFLNTSLKKHQHVTHK